LQLEVEGVTVFFETFLDNLKGWGGATELKLQTIDEVPCVLDDDGPILLNLQVLLLNLFELDVPVNELPIKFAISFLIKEKFFNL
jgi:hypothetical protein